jgi:hypothetical protein
VEEHRLGMAHKAAPASQALVWLWALATGSRSRTINVTPGMMLRTRSGLLGCCRLSGGSSQSSPEASRAVGEGTALRITPGPAPIGC